MKKKCRLCRGVVLAGLVFTLPASLSANDLVKQLIERIVANEQKFLERMGRYKPILETYIQEISKEEGRGWIPIQDHYMIGKLDTTKEISHKGFFVSAGFRKSDTTVFYPAGFAQMVIPDAHDFNQQTYDFEYERREFLGDVRTLVFDVTPKDREAVGKFIGRIWVEDRDYHIVRFNGTYTMSKASSLFFHFDSWRVNVEPGGWMPKAVYVEDANYDPKGRGNRFRAQTRLWGYHPVRKSKIEELTTILIEAENPVRDDAQEEYISPLESQRIWMRQAEQNVIERLEESGLLAPEGEVDEVLNTVVNNLIVTNELNVDAHCRVLLTTPLETFSVGEAIIVSRGLLDVLPGEPGLAAVLATELAHIVLGHGTETMWAFSDRTMFNDLEVLNELGFERSPEEIEAANEKAMDFLSQSPYGGKLAEAGLFFKSLAGSAARVPNLVRPNLGNPLAGERGLVRLAQLAEEAPELKENQLEQIAALPLGSRIRLDPWTNRLTLIQSNAVTLLSARDKMPFQVTPFMVHLKRVQAEDRKRRVKAPEIRDSEDDAAQGADVKEIDTRQARVPQ